MKPRGYWGTLLTLLVILIPLSVVLWSLLFAWGTHRSLGEVFLEVGLWTGLIFGAGMALGMAFILKARTIVVPILDRDAFVAKLHGELGKIGYQPESQTQDGFTFRPTGRGGILAPKITVRMEQDSATIVGPSLQTKKLKKRM